MSVLPVFAPLRAIRQAALLALLLFALPAVQSEDNTSPDPVPIQRILLPPEKLAAELERAQRGVLVQMPRADFEARVRRAAETTESLNNPPRLVEARYSAKLIDTALVGTGEWKIVNPLNRPGILPVQPLNLALLRAQWPDRRDAVLAELEQNQLGLLVETPGQSTLSLDWSARSVPMPPGLRFSLDVPPCAIASLELELPADRLVDVSGARETYLLAGPLPASARGHRLWRLALAGKSAITLEIRRTTGPDLPAPLVLTKSLTTRLELTPGQLQADFDFELKVLHGGVRSLRCECPVGLRPYEVTVRNLESWELRPSPGKGAPATLDIQLREPSVPEWLQVRCLAPLASGSDWTAPGLRLVGALPSGETLHLRVHPGVLMENWQPGNVFRLTRSTFQADGWQQLTLTAGLDSDPNPNRPAPVRPSARIQVPGPEYKVRELLWWQIDPDRPSLTAQFNYEVINGRLFSLPVALPAGWEVEQVDLTPADLLQHRSVLTEKGKTILAVDLQRALDPASGARLTVRLRPTAPFKTAPAGQSLTIPDVAPQGARLREGALGISVASLFQATANASLPAVPLDPGDDLGSLGGMARPPWGKQLLDFYFPFQGQPAEGTIVLRPRPPQVRARCTSDVVIASGRALALTRLELRPEIGAPSAIDLFLSAPSPGGWEWKTARGTNAVARFERHQAADTAPLLRVLATRHPLLAIAGLPSPAPGQWWRLSFAQPLREPVTLEASLELTDQGPVADPAVHLAPLAGNRPVAVLALAVASQHVAEQASRQRRWEVPLVTVPGADRLDGQVTLHLAGSDLVQVRAEGLREVVEPTPPERDPQGEPLSAPFALSPGSSWRTFRYSHPPIALTLRGGVPTADRATEAVADHASLTSHLGPDGQLRHRFRFQVANWRQQTLPVRLPAEVRLEAVRVNGHWVDRLPPGEGENGSRVYELPVLPGAAQHRFEIIYASDLPSWSLWTTLPAPVPVLPVRMVAFRRVWRLPAGVAPLAEGSLLGLPGGGEVGRAGAVGDYRATLPSADAPDWAGRQEQQLADAIAALRKQHRPRDEWPLGEVLQRLVFDHLKEQPLVVDVRALRAADLGRGTLLGAGAWEGANAVTPLAAPWESIGIVHLPCRPAPVLTSRPQLAAWTAARGGAAGRWIEEAVAEAVLFGHDRSGRFRTVPDWMQLPDVLGPMDAHPSTAADIFSSPGGNWIEWEMLAGSGPGSSLVVVRQSALPLVGVVLTAVLTFGALRLAPQSDRRRRRMVLIWLAAAGLAMLWLPPALRGVAWGPAVAGIVVAVFWVLRPIRPVAPPAIAAPLTGALAILLAVAGALGDAPPPKGPATVYLLSGENGKESVLVPPALLTQLQALERRGLAGLRGVVLLSAVYDGVADHTAAAFEAKYQVYNFADEGTLTLPLTGVQLTRAELDNAPAHLGPRNTLRVTGRGPHSLTVRFTALVGGTGDDAELRLGIPELPRSRLTFRGPAQSGYLFAVDDERVAKGTVPAQVRGAQQVEREGPYLRLRADLGAVKTLALRWHKDVPQPANVSVKEGYYWNLQASAARLLAVLQYTVSKGWQKTFELELPGDLEVASVEAGAVADAPHAPRLQEWRLRAEGGARRLRLEFHTPVTHSVEVTLELVPRQPFTRTAILPFPTPLDAKQVQGFLAYRTEGVEAAVAQHHAITGDKKEVLDRAFTEMMARPWRRARDQDLSEPTRAYWRAKGGVLHLILRSPTSQAECVQEISWRIAPRQAVLRASAKITSPDNNLALLEWEIPAGLQVIEVAGSQVQRWTRSGARIQVWLQKPTGEATLQLTGWLPRSSKEPAQFAIPLVRLADMKKQRLTLRLAGEGVALTPGKLGNLTARPELGTPGRELAFETEQEGYGGTVQTRPATTRGDFQLLTFAEVQDRELRFTALLRGSIREGELGNLTVTLRNWDGADVTLTAPEVARTTEKRLGAAGRTWTLELKPGVNKSYQLTLAGKLPLGSASAVFLPDVHVETATGTIQLERWIAVAGSELAPEGASGLVEAPKPAEALQPWPREAERVRRTHGTAWRIAADDWGLRLRPRTPASRAAVVQVFLTEFAASVSNGQRWLHQATYWLYHEAGADLSVVLPPGATLLSVAMDNVSVLPLQSGSDRLWLPLPGGAGVRSLQLSWEFINDKEPFEVPHLAAPRLDGVPEGPAVWVVAAPGGYQDVRRALGSRTPADVARPISAAALDLARAAAQQRLLAFLLDRAPDGSSLVPQVIAAQERFEQLARRAEYQLAQQPTSAGTGPDGQPLTSWLQQLRDENGKLTRSTGFDRIREETKTAAPQGPAALWSVSPLEQGRPLYWQAATAQAIPLLRLVPEETIRSRQAWTASTLLLIVLFAWWILWRSFRIAAWPEQLALLGCLGLVLFGGPWGLFFLMLPAVWLGVRAGQLARWAQSLVPRQRKPELLAPTGSGIIHPQ